MLRTSLTLVTAPVAEPVTTQEAKDWLRVGGATEDTLIDSLVTAARQKAEEFLRGALVDTTFDYGLDQLPGTDRIVLPVSPLSSVTSVTSYDEASVSTVFASSKYHVDTLSKPGRVVLINGETWPTDLRPWMGLVIRFVAGYGAAATDVPVWAKKAIERTVATWFENREDLMTTGGVNLEKLELPLSAMGILAPYRVLRF